MISGSAGVGAVVVDGVVDVVVPAGGAAVVVGVVAGEVGWVETGAGFGTSAIAWMSSVLTPGKTMSHRSVPGATSTDTVSVPEAGMLGALGRAFSYWNVVKLLP